MNPFAAIPKSWSEIVEFISHSSTGRKILREIQPHFQSEKIQVQAYPESIRSRLLAVAAQGEPLGALFVTDGETGTIYVDMKSELGVVVPFAFHEMIHSLDENLWNAAKRPIQATQKKELVFQSECKAFREQHIFLEEMKALYPQLREFLRLHYPSVPFLNREFLPHEIAGLYVNIENLL